MTRTNSNLYTETATVNRAVDDDDDTATDRNSIESHSSLGIVKSLKSIFYLR